MDLTKYGINSNNKILSIALTHTSYANEHHIESYERLEYLGDAVLELIISEYLFKNTTYTEGEMSKIRSSYVCEEALVEYARTINLKDHILVASNIDEPNNTVISDVFFFFLATIYLNNGYNKAKEFVLDIAKPYIDEKKVFLSDYKSYLQEMVQTDQRSVEYRVIKEEGPAHDKTFTVEVLIEGIVYAKGVGKNKKAAEQDAAKNAINLSAGVIK